VCVSRRLGKCFGKCPWDKRACTSAAFQCHLEILKYLHEHGCPWDEWTIQRALQNNHIDCAKYARAHGCPEELMVKMVKELNDEYFAFFSDD